MKNMMGKNSISDDGLMMISNKCSCQNEEDSRDVDGGVTARQTKACHIFDVIQMSQKELNFH